MPSHNLQTFLESFLQQERRINLPVTLREMATTSSVIYGLIGFSGLFALLFPTWDTLNQSAIVIACSIALLTSFGFYLCRNCFPLWLSIAHMFLAVALVTYAVWGGQTEMGVAASMIYILTAIHAFHFFQIRASLAIVTLIAISFGWVANLNNWAGWPSVLVLIIGCSITAGIVVHLLVKRLHTLATTDKLTGAYNRHTWDAIFESEVSYAKRYKQTLCLLMVDLDYFKTINDKHGHQEGDRVLITVAENIRQCLRGSDIFARWGGDEFIILLRMCDADTAKRMEQRIHEKLEGIIDVTIGLAEFDPSEEFDHILMRADTDLLEKKSRRPSRPE